MSNLITVQGAENLVSVSATPAKIDINPIDTKIEIQSQGAQGAQGATGQGVPTGGTARQALTKIDGTDYNTEFKSNWFDYSINVEYTGAETAITAGTVYTCSIDSGTIYRFVNSTNNANGYPSEDSFYTNFDGVNLANLITTRG